jgi:hypothetical protein
MAERPDYLRMFLLFCDGVLCRLSCAAESLPEVLKIGGRGGTRTPDPLLAKQVLCQLSYTPIGIGCLGDYNVFMLRVLISSRLNLNLRRVIQIIHQRAIRSQPRDETAPCTAFSLHSQFGRFPPE